jgi:hypothetical protein
VQWLCIVAYRDRGLERERVTEKTSKSRGDYASMIREQHGVSKPTEIKYFKFYC